MLAPEEEEEEEVVAVVAAEVVVQEWDVFHHGLATIAPLAAVDPGTVVFSISND